MNESNITKQLDDLGINFVSDDTLETYGEPDEITIYNYEGLIEYVKE